MLFDNSNMLKRKRMDDLGGKSGCSTDMMGKDNNDLDKKMNEDDKNGN